MTSFKVELKNIISNESTRSSAAKAREKILQLLLEHDLIQLDLNGVNFTPSVADEIIGELASLFGAEKFKQKLQVINYTETQRALMVHVISRRIKRNNLNISQSL